MSELFVADEEMYVDGAESSQQFDQAAQDPQDPQDSQDPQDVQNPITEDSTLKTENNDPIVKSIPIIMGRVNNTETQTLHLLQFPGRPKNLKYANIKTAIKPDSACFEAQVPLDTSKFYDETKATEWGSNVVQHRLQGVMDHMDNHSGPSSTFVGRLVDGKMILIPIDRSVQLRPSFTYLDDMETAKQMQRRSEIAAENAATGTPASKVQVLQTSVAKSQGQGNAHDGVASHALGESLRSIKKFQEEPWSNLELKDSQEDIETVKNSLFVASDNVLHTKLTLDDYINQLTL